MFDLRKFSLPLLVALGTGCLPETERPLAPFVFAEESQGRRVESNLLAQLNAIEGVVAKKQDYPDPEYETYEVVLQQPVDHKDATRGTFGQRVFIFYAGNDSPVVFNPQGYELRQELQEPTLLLYKATQVSVEHRFYGASLPDKPLYDTLTFEQAANDLHRVVTTLKPLLGKGQWISTGVSKSGATAIIHRRFFPDDVRGTIAYVPAFYNGLRDQRYADFMATIGPKECREHVFALQRRVLKERENALPLFVKATAIEDATDVRQVSRFEMAVVAYLWTFWQYDGLRKCQFLPAKDAPLAELVEHLAAPWKRVNGDKVGEKVRPKDPNAVSEEGWLRPHSVQRAQEIGGPIHYTAHIKDLLEIHDPQVVDAKTAHLTFQAESSKSIQSWVSEKAERLMLIYGEYDPFTAGALPARGKVAFPELGSPLTTARNARFIVPKTSHEASGMHLGPKERKQFTFIVSYYADLAIDADWTDTVHRFLIRPVEPQPVAPDVSDDN